ncbi:Fujikurins efflux protein [Vanrija pseudolonga]|uniref:Fujikurins efflux protein n=1 Tax=Vanrija pseudolonga TaxID=143232 RepID=A0AAF1BJN9_9TREE|nr:Fujikurins efflux protein [Vanrija pseudolonga]
MAAAGGVADEHTAAGSAPSVQATTPIGILADVKQTTSTERLDAGTCPQEKEKDVVDAGGEAAAPTTSDENDIGPPPDGGFQAWSVVASSVLLLFAVFGFMNANGQLQAYWLQNQLKAYSKSDVAWQGSIQTLVEFGLAIITGRYFDVHGARVLTISGLVGTAAAICGMAFSYKYYQLLLSNIMFGVAASCVYAPANAVAAHWFLKRRSTALAIIVGGGGLGGVVYPILIENLFNRMSYRDTMLIVMGINVVLMLPSVFFMRARLPPRTPPPFSDMKKPWKDVRYTFLVVGAMMYGMNILSPFFHALPYAASNNVPDHIGQYAIAMAGAGSVVGRLASGVLADRIGVWYVFGSIGFSTAVVLFAFWTPPGIGTAPTVIGLVTYGWVSGSWFALIGSATASISPVEEVGMRIGMLISCLSVPSLIGPVITGELISVGKDKWTYAGIWCGACALLSGILVILPRLTVIIRNRRNPTPTPNKSPEPAQCVWEETLPSTATAVGLEAGNRINEASHPHRITSRAGR